MRTNRRDTRSCSGLPFAADLDCRECRQRRIAVCEKVADGKGNFGYNAATDVYEDLVEAGVIDPTKVVRTALENAASVATLLLTSDALIAEKPKDEGKKRALRSFVSIACGARQKRRPTAVASTGCRPSCFQGTGSRCTVRASTAVMAIVRTSRVIEHTTEPFGLVPSECRLTAQKAAREATPR